jgi:hypothetical protein
MKPGQVDLGLFALWEGQVQRHGIGNRLPQVVAAERVDLAWRCADEGQDDGDIMRPQAPEHVLFAPDRSQVHSDGLNPQDTADGAGRDEVLEPGNGRMVSENMADHEPSVQAPCQGGQFLGMVEFERERLFDKDMLAGQQGALGEVAMS